MLSRVGPTTGLVLIPKTTGWGLISGGRTWVAPVSSGIPQSFVVQR